MGEIKSALEIALERTKSVVVNKESVEANKFQKEGKSLVSKFLDDTTVNLGEGLKKYDKKQVQWVKEGIFQVLLANLVLPQEQLALKKARRVGEAFFLVIRDKRLLKSIFTQLESFYEEYIGEKERLRESLVQQYTPRLRQKEEELSKKMGGPVNIDVNSDPEFVSLLRKALSQLDDRYQAVLNQVKDQLSSIFQPKG
jgi:hypothetical protein